MSGTIIRPSGVDGGGDGNTVVVSPILEILTVVPSGDVISIASGRVGLARNPTIEQDAQVIVDLDAELLIL